jgi:hypothetical protein
MSGALLRYPRGATLDSARATLGSIECHGRASDRATLCALANHSQNGMVLAGLPQGCASEVALSFVDGKLSSVTCADISQSAIDRLDELARAKWGQPKTGNTQIAGMRVHYLEWKSKTTTF